MVVYATFALGVTVITAVIALVVGRPFAKNHFMAASVASGLAVPLSIIAVTCWRLHEMPANPPPVDAGAMLTVAAAAMTGLALPFSLATSFLMLRRFRNVA